MLMQDSERICPKWTNGFEMRQRMVKAVPRAAADFFRQLKIHPEYLCNQKCITILNIDKEIKKDDVVLYLFFEHQ